MTIALWWLPLVTATVLVWSAVGLPMLSHEQRERGHLAQLLALAVLGLAGPIVVTTSPHLDPSAPSSADLGSRASGLPVLLSTALLLVLAAVVVLSSRYRPTVGGSVMAGLVGFAAATALTFSATPKVAALTLLPVLPAGIFYFSAAGWLATLRTLRWALRVTVWTSLVLGVVGVSWATFGAEPGRYLSAFGRLSGVGGHPNALGAGAAALLLLEIVKPRGVRWPLYAAVAALALLLTGSRTATLGLALGLVWMLVVRRGLARWLALASTVAIVIGLARTPPDVGNLTGRTVLWHHVWDVFTAHPVLGYGAGFLTPEYKAAYLPSRLAWAGQAHDQLLHTLAASGLIGGLALVIYLVVLTVAALRAAERTGGATAGLLGLLLAECVTETPLLPALGTLMLLHLGLLAAVFAGSREQRVAGEASSVTNPRTSVRQSHPPAVGPHMEEHPVAGKLP